jgi:hypothetical protein
MMDGLMCHFDGSFLLPYPFYNTESELLELRLDPDILRENLNRRAWRSMGKRFLCARLEKRMQLLEKVYHL